MGKTYLPAPNQDYPPDSPTLSLGKIWGDPLDPGSCINFKTCLPLSGHTKIQKGKKILWEDIKHGRKNGVLGFWLGFLQYIGVSTELSVNWDVSRRQENHFVSLDTEFIDPSPDYLEASMQTSEVWEVMERENFEISVYMVTGVKIARGATVHSSGRRSHGGKGVMGVDGTAGGAPAAGFKASFDSSRSDATSYIDSSDFIFAYRLREIFYRKGMLRHKQVTKGALYSTSNTQMEHDATRTGVSPSQETGIEIEGLDEKDLWVRDVDWQFNKFEDLEDDCDLIIPVKKNI